MPAYRCGGCGATYDVRNGIASLVPEGVEPTGYDAALFDLVEAVQTRHFWFRARNELILSALRFWVPPRKRPRVLEIGCGTGGVLAGLVADGVAAEGADLFLEPLRRCRARLGVPLWRVDARRLPFVAEFDAVGLFDCLEHLDDEAAVLAGVRRSLRPGGVALITVPALPALWSRLDVLSRHRRRYTKSSLVNTVRRSGLEILRASYFNAPLLPVLWFQRRVLGWWRPLERERALRVPRGAINEMLYRLLRGERWFLERAYEPVIGTSLLVVARHSGRG